MARGIIDQGGRAVVVGWTENIRGAYVLPSDGDVLYDGADTRISEIELLQSTCCKPRCALGRINGGSEVEALYVLGSSCSWSVCWHFRHPLICACWSCCMELQLLWRLERNCLRQMRNQDCAGAPGCRRLMQRRSRRREPGRGNAGPLPGSQSAPSCIDGHPEAGDSNDVAE
jgi:hypothetical protein